MTTLNQFKRMHQMRGTIRDTLIDEKLRNPHVTVGDVLYGMLEQHEGDDTLFRQAAISLQLYQNKTTPAHDYLLRRNARPGIVRLGRSIYEHLNVPKFD